MDFSYGFSRPAGELVSHILQAEGICPRIPCVFCVSAENTTVSTDIGVIEVLVMDEKRLSAMTAHPRFVGQKSETIEVRGLVQGHGVLKIKTFTGKIFVSNGLKARICDTHENLPGFL
jgi:hypothetical protein